MKMNINVVRLSMKDQINSYIQNTKIITKCIRGSSKEIPLSYKMNKSHVNLAAIEAMAQYFALALDLETESYFFALQDK